MDKKRGRVIVQFRADGTWIGGYTGAHIYWIDSQRLAWSFKSQRQFRRWYRRIVGRGYRKLFRRGDLRFVRAWPRTVSK